MTCLGRGLVLLQMVYRGAEWVEHEVELPLVPDHWYVKRLFLVVAVGGDDVMKWSDLNEWGYPFDTVLLTNTCGYRQALVCSLCNIQHVTVSAITRCPLPAGHVISHSYSP